MTGAPVPAGADAVLQAESAEETTDTPPRLRVQEAVPPGRHIGRAGEDVSAGTLVRAVRQEDEIRTFLAAKPAEERVWRDPDNFDRLPLGTDQQCPSDCHLARPQGLCKVLIDDGCRGRARPVLSGQFAPELWCQAENV